MTNTIRTRAVLAVLGSALLLAGTAGATLGAPADLDLEWSDDGIAINAVNSSGVPARVATMPDGRVVASADCLGASFDFCVFRYNADGTLDTTFDGDGIAQADFAGASENPWAVGVQGDGKIVAAGECGPNSTSTMCVARWNVDGRLDATFDGDGRVTIGGFTADGGDSADGRAMVIQPDGRIVVAGPCFHFNAQFTLLQEACLARLNTDGSLDTDFGGDGKVVRDLGSAFDNVLAVGLQSDGSIVIGGACPPSGAPRFCLARFTSGGGTDATFGVVTTLMGLSGSTITDLAINDTDQVVAVGQCQALAFAEPSICVARYNADGSLDTSFDGDGTTSIQPTLNGVGGNAGGSTVALQSNGKILAANGCANPGFKDFCVVRFNANGTPDVGFGTGGVAFTSTNSTGNNDWATDVAVAADGKILAAGLCAAPMCIVRFVGDTDTSPPKITLSVDAADTVAGSGWYNAGSSGTNGILVNVLAEDPSGVTNITCLNGVAEVLNTSSASASFVLGDGTHSISCVASDGINAPGAAGGSTAMPVSLEVDQTAPTVTCVSPPSVLLHEVVATLKVADVGDATSGPTATEFHTAFPDTNTAGLRPTGVNPTDLAGNTRNATCNYRVTYVFTGFAAPISSSSFGYVNAVIGKVIPFRFTLTDANGQPVLGVTSATLSDVAGTCSGTSGTLATADYAKGKLGLISLGNGAYELRWKAPKTDRNQCRLVSLTLPDGVAHGANIRFAP